MNRPVKRIFRSALIAAASPGVLAAPAYASDEDNEQAEKEMTEGEKELAKLLEGRVAGEPRSCIPQTPNQRMRVIDETAIVFGSGNTIYVNTTRHPEDLDNDEVMVIRRYGGSRLCKLDIITTVDRFSGFYSGNVFLSDFVPYTRVEEKDDD